MGEEEVKEVSSESRVEDFKSDEAIFFEEKKTEVIRKVKTGEDKEGRLMYDAYVTSYDDQPEVFGNLGKVYKRAYEAAEEIDKAGGANKLRELMVSLHRIGGLKQYEPHLEVEGGVDEQDKASYVKERLLKDLGDIKFALADRHMEAYYQQRARVEVSREELRRLIDKRDFSRAKFRVASYNLEREEINLLYGVELPVLTKLRKRDSEDTLPEIRSESRQYEQDEYQGMPDEESERERLIEERVLAYEQELASRKDEKTAKAFKNIDTEQKRRLISDLIDTQQREENLEANLEKSLAGSDPEAICGLVNDINEASLSEESIRKEIDVAIANQKVVDTIAEMESSFSGIGKAIREGGIRNALSEFVNSYDNLKLEFRGITREIISEQADEVLRELRRVSASASEYLAKARNLVDEAYQRSAGKLVHWGIDSIKKTREKFKGAYHRIRGQMRVGRINTQVFVRESIWGLNIAKTQALGAIAAEKSATRKRVGLTIERAFSSEEILDENGYPLTPEGISDERKEFYQEQRGRFEKMKSENPYFRKLDEKLLSYFSFKATPVETQQEVVAEDNEPQVVEEKPKVETKEPSTKEDKDEINEPEKKEQEKESQKVEGKNNEPLPGKENDLLNEIKEAREQVESSRLDYETYTNKRYEELLTGNIQFLFSKLFSLHSNANTRFDTEGLGSSLTDQEVVEFNQLNARWDELESQIGNLTTEDARKIVKEFDDIATRQWALCQSPINK